MVQSLSFAPPLLLVLPQAMIRLSASLVLLIQSLSFAPPLVLLLPLLLLLLQALSFAPPLMLPRALIRPSAPPLMSP